jgi:nitrite reductase/ring-hydroxylating ferredoxin subunit/DMSO/TMAO reductase YedYZ heme-binding membrane subunit
MAGLIVLSVGLFAGVTAATNPNFTAETLIIRGTSITALLLLHVILCVGPLARLDERFLPILFNRRHLGVAMFFLALVHGAFATIQFHALGDANPIASIFTAYQKDYNPFVQQSANISDFPFEPFGALALAIFFLMAATSHDFWLKNLGASFWKALHALVYAAYGLVLVHVFYGVLQSERNPLYPILLGVGFLTVFGLHFAAWNKERALDKAKPHVSKDGFIDACAASDLVEGCGHVANIGTERVAIFLHGGEVFGLSNVCRHQGGPIGEGKIVDGCATCPWHGWNYRPEDGMSPPPFKEIVPTYNVRVEGGRVWVHPEANPLETKVVGASAGGGATKLAEVSSEEEQE